MVQLSPAELLMGQAIRSNVPQVEEVFIPKWPYLEKFRQDNNRCKRRQKSDFDRSHRTRPLANIPEDTEVWIRTVNQQIPGQIAITAHTAFLHCGHTKRTANPPKSFTHNSNAKAKSKSYPDSISNRNTNQSSRKTVNLISQEREM